ncbi:MAG: Ser-Thr-rich GPI-anchored membrane family protein [Candidatus Hermodarchaeota archaeon]
MNNNRKNQMYFGILYLLIMGTQYLNPSTLIQLKTVQNTSTSFQPKGSNGVGNVVIYVNSTIYSSINIEIQRYVQDITAQGYNATLINWSNPNVNNLKTNISNYYGFGLDGIILIGELPYAMARHWDSSWSKYWYFPTDLFLMDLDGLWNDINFNNYYDIDSGEHINGTGDWEPEIWLGRISPFSMNVLGVNYTAELKDYFDRNHAYRTGTLSRAHKACLYIDDDWSNYANEWASNFTAYTGSQLDVYSTNSLTNSTNYMEQLNKMDYEFVHVLVHSWPTNHIFGPSGSGTDGVLTYTDIWTNTTHPLFYNLYACYSNNFTQTNNIGTHYLFSNDTLCVIGSSRSGGMDLYQPFYDNLSINATIGTAFNSWFYNPEIEQWGKTQLYEGMTILGDPLLTIKMHETIPESLNITNPTSTCTWYKDSVYEIRWTWQGTFSNVDITLWNGSGIVLTIASAANNNGSFFWTVPNSLVDGNDYFIKLDDMDGTPSDISENFTIMIKPKSPGIPGSNIYLIGIVSLIVIIYLVTDTSKKNRKVIIR